MKRQFLKFSALILSLGLVWGCDNNFSEVPVVDNPPKISLGAITSGLTEGEDFKLEVTLTDGVDKGTISTLASFSYTITLVSSSTPSGTQGGSTVFSGSQDLTGDSEKVTILIPGGFEPGDYNLDILVLDSNGNQSTENLSFKVGLARPDFDITGEWTMEPVAGAMKVGPTPGSAEWWQNSAGDVTARACFFDDIYTFNADGKFDINMGSSTWVEAWQGVAADGCGAPIAPFDGSGSYTYTYTSTTLTLIGEGAHLGLAKVNNSGEISNGAAVADQIAYTIVEQSQVGDTRKMTLRIEAGSGVWWEFKLISGAPAISALVGNWKMEPVEGALAVGPTAGSQEWWSNSAQDVTTRSCFFDDVYTFEADGTFSMDMGSETWLEAWQGVAADGCGAPIAPHDGSGSYGYQYDGATLKLTGQGAHVGLAKAVNAGELPSVVVPNDVTYQVVSLTENAGVKRMTLHIETGSGVWWTFKLISE
ncbi:hypothetical protein [Algoriphagus sp. CAU 1675]|uniref:hypothetical protein n=1 Tax=Algoriphagus sp. CAU 1675 TaxID=3032597 RepID=UPI0023DAB427|nr:hypothetical protein [Algoriphagus sp. CAU 1675]MDF2158797.1 hypothetical protein [Algoriphagus sp. CAU 1675]